MACRLGPLRAGRSLRDACTPFGSRLSLVAYVIFVPTSGRPQAEAWYTRHEGYAALAERNAYLPQTI